MSELHLQLIRERLKRRDKVEVDTKEPKIPYRETIQTTAEGSYRHKKQSGGRGQFGEVHIRMYPLPTGTNAGGVLHQGSLPADARVSTTIRRYNFLWVDSIVGGTIPNNFLPAVEKGFKERIERGVIAGYQVQNVCVEVHFGKHHPVDSSEAAFKIAGSMAFRNVFQQAKPGLLEPIVNAAHHRARRASWATSTATCRAAAAACWAWTRPAATCKPSPPQVPLSEVTTYARSLSSMTGGQGSYTMEFSHYDVVPGNVQKEIIDKAVMKEEEEE